MLLEISRTKRDRLNARAALQARKHPWLVPHLDGRNRANRYRRIAQEWPEYGFVKLKTTPTPIKTVHMA